MRLKLVTPPASEPVSLDEAKAHCRVDISDEDDLFSDDLIPSARQYLEGAMRRAFISQTWRLNLDEWPDCDEIELPYAPLQSVSSVVYLDKNGDSTTWDSANYIVDADSEPGRIVLASGVSWPGETLYPANPIQITFVAGYGDATDVPAYVKRAMKLLIGHWYEHREAAIDGSPLREIPLAVDSLIYLHRAY